MFLCKSKDIEHMKIWAHDTIKYLREFTEDITFLFGIYKFLNLLLIRFKALDKKLSGLFRNYILYSDN